MSTTTTTTTTTTTLKPIKPIKIWGAGGPNPPKVAILVKELGLPHEIVPISFEALKQEPYITQVNINGRMPAIYDPNTDLTLWESGAIIEYLVETYDKEERKLSFEPGTKDAWLARQWLYFQVSGQGPYYGQVAWFLKFAPEKIPLAIERYTKEIHRVTAVLERQLSRKKDEDEQGAVVQGGPWLVGDEFSYADLAFVTWQSLVPVFLSKDAFDPDEYPEVKAWLERIHKREAVATTFAAMQTSK
ncbi:glutathione S-transferase [Pleomassaria siparia CBS 279.74]|uniref:Glutathione S-transferase n=1 Tax=Pleomassaria siparia CBS 279.74 TaxID=1314801 RepID=A0A6G1K7F3_9PLEO|nr:glutathione S-transferase [Pleomassaria siparia CBS 279.74]